MGFGGVAMTNANKPPESVPITLSQAAVMWITALQTAHLFPSLPSIRVKGYDGDDSDWTEIDLFNDDASALVDGTWHDALYFPEEEE